MTAAPQPVRSGTADQLARVAHFRAVEHTQPDELDFLALWLLGDVGGPETRWALWEQLRPAAEHLWAFVTDDWDENDCDPMCAEEAEMPAGHGWDACADRTRERLTFEIENQVWLARIAAADARYARTTGVPA